MTRGQCGNCAGERRAPNAIAHNSVLTLGAQIVQIGAVLVFAPFTLGVLGPDRLGAFSLVCALVTYFTVLDLGLGRAVTQGVSATLAQRDYSRVFSLFWSAALMQTGLGVLAASALIVCAPALLSPMNIPGSLRSDVLTSIKICAASIPLVFLSASFTGLFHAANRFDVATSIAVPTAIFTQAVPWLVALRCPRLGAIAGGLLAVRIASTLASAGAAARLFQGLFWRSRFQRADCVRLLRFGGWITVTNTVGPFLTYADRFLIGALLPVSAVAYYAIPYDAIMRLTALPACVSAAAFPILSGLSNSPDRRLATDVLARSVNVVGCVMAIPVIAVCGLGSDLTALWLGADFAARSGPVLQILCCGVYINAFAVLPYTALQAAGHPDITAKIHMVEVVPHLTALALLISVFGIAGAAIAWALRAALDAGLIWWAALRLALAARETFRNELRTFGAALAVACGLTVLQTNISPAVVRVAIAITSAGAVTWFISWRFLEARTRIQVQCWVQNFLRLAVPSRQSQTALKPAALGPQLIEGTGHGKPMP